MMRVLVGLTFLLVASVSQAATKLVCREFDGDRMTVVVELSPNNQTPLTRSGGLKEGEEYLFHMEIYTNDVVTPDRAFEGTVQTEDVSFSFNSEDEKVGMWVYMDELDHSGISTEDGERRLVCY